MITAGVSVVFSGGVMVMAFPITMGAMVSVMLMMAMVMCLAVRVSGFPVRIYLFQKLQQHSLFLIRQGGEHLAMPPYALRIGIFCLPFAFLG